MGDRVSGRFRDRVVIVTGAARGVGARAVELFVDEEARVVAGDIRIDELQERFGDAHRQVVPVQADVRCKRDCRALVAAAIEIFGQVDVLFNNAGITVRSPLEETSDDMWNDALNTNLRGVFYCCRFVVPHMRQQKGGAIVNNASINAIRGNVGLSAYSAAKGGVVAITRALAAELAPDGIRVNSLCPGTIDTAMTAEYLEGLPEPEAARVALIRKHPLGRLGTADDIARAALFLASDDASFITGAAIPVDGGRHLI